jgi:ABC-type spermidine/putrescine transport system permease subunit I
MNDGTARAIGPLSRLIPDMDRDRALRAGLLILLCLWLVVFVVLPLSTLMVKSVSNKAGRFVGFENFLHYFETPALAASFGNSLLVSILTTGVAVALGFAYAYALTRTAIPAKGFFFGVAMMPLFAPTLLNGIVLIYLFGKKGLVTTGFFGLLPFGVDIGLYGAVGIVLAEVLYVFPQAVLILTMALRTTDARFYEAARSMGASPGRVFFTVTLPGVRYGLVSACFVGFILCFTDFGAPKVVGAFSTSWPRTSTSRSSAAEFRHGSHGQRDSADSHGSGLRGRPDEPQTAVGPDRGPLRSIGPRPGSSARQAVFSFLSVPRPGRDRFFRRGGPCLPGQGLALQSGIDSGAYDFSRMGGGGYQASATV